MTKEHRILIVGSYPMVNPKHGGQKRVAAIYDAYRKRGMTVTYVSVVPGRYYLDRTRHDVPVSADTMKAIEETPFLNDVICGEAIFTDLKVRPRIKRVIKKFKPSIIHVEQAYPYLGLKKLMSEMSYKAKIINGTQNIEWLMKDQIYKSEGMERSLRSKIITKIKRLEQELAQDASLNVAVSDGDAQSLKEQFRAKNIVVAPNGMERQGPKLKELQRWQSYFDENLIKSKVLFVGSAHTPNMTGFLKMVSKRIGFLPYDTRILVVGGVADLLHRHSTDAEVEDACFGLRAALLGRVSEADLSALLNLADLIILPITEGGGSNLKTAEALLANKKIVATTHAFRGYEQYIGYPNITITDSPDKFKSSILEQLKAPLQAHSKDQAKHIEEVSWQSALAPLVDRVEAL